MSRTVSGGRPSPRLLGMHGVTAGLLAVQSLMFLFNVVVFHRSGLSLEWTDMPQSLGVIAVLLGLWGYFATYPGRNPNDWGFGELFLMLALFLMLGIQAGPGQYAAATLRRPLADAWLASADSAIGVDVRALTSWTHQHPLIARELTRAYFTLLPQFFLPFLVLGFLYRDRRAMWEYMFHFHVASFVTLVCFALWPAAAPFGFQQFDPVIDHTRFIRHFAGLRTGAMTVVSMGDLEGLVTFPSFHVAGALIVTWAFRRTRLWLLGLSGVNLALIAATVMTGTHYLVDIVASVVLLTGSVFLYNRVAHTIYPRVVRDIDAPRAKAA